uniref:Importin-9 isoform X2 n=1 Tax=Populus alba TaxID=43335 RepID=A0A4U5M9S7_POPAL|nr:importin-9 isoform X2 [Populus alba]
MAIALIAVYDWPENWPDLLPFLLKLINDRTNVSGVHGALRCLALLSRDLDDTVVPTLVLVLFPCLLTIVSSPQNYDNYLRPKALTIVYSCVSVLGIMSGVAGGWRPKGEEAAGKGMPSVLIGGFLSVCEVRRSRKRGSCGWVCVGLGEREGPIRKRLF